MIVQQKNPYSTKGLPMKQSTVELSLIQHILSLHPHLSLLQNTNETTFWTNELIQL